MQQRKKIIQKFLKEDEYVVSLTSFPLLGCPNFTTPAHNPTDLFQQYNSMFYSNDIIMDRSLFKSATFNKIDRTGSQPVINVPVFDDTCTPKPFVEELPNGMRAKPNVIYMDHDGFAMGCCCLQVWNLLFLLMSLSLMCKNLKFLNTLTNRSHFKLRAVAKPAISTTN